MKISNSTPNYINQVYGNKAMETEPAGQEKYVTDIKQQVETNYL